MSKPAQYITQVNVNAVGAHNESIPVYPTTPPFVIYKRQGKTMHRQRIHVDPDINIAKDTPLYPPYQHYPDSLNIIQGATNNKLDNKLVS